MSVMLECPFCDIVRGNGPAFELYRDDHSVAFLDINPAVDGHTLVATTHHYPTLLEMDAGVVGPFFETVQRVATGVRDAFDADGVSVFQSSGSAAGQDVFHAHAHVLPRYDDDGITLAPPRSSLSSEEGERTADRIRNSLDEYD